MPALIAQIGDASAEFGWQPAALQKIAEVAPEARLESRSAFATLLTGDGRRSGCQRRMDAMLARRPHSRWMTARRSIASSPPSGCSARRMMRRLERPRATALPQHPANLRSPR
jgi:hypothetical protein